MLLGLIVKTAFFFRTFLVTFGADVPFRFFRTKYEPMGKRVCRVRAVVLSACSIRQNPGRPGGALYVRAYDGYFQSYIFKNDTENRSEQDDNGEQYSLHNLLSYHRACAQPVCVTDRVRTLRIFGRNNVAGGLQPCHVQMPRRKHRHVRFPLLSGRPRVRRGAVRRGIHIRRNLFPSQNGIFGGNRVSRTALCRSSAVQPSDKKAG